MYLLADLFSVSHLEDKVNSLLQGCDDMRFNQNGMLPTSWKYSVITFLLQLIVDFSYFTVLQ